MTMYRSWYHYALRPIIAAKSSVSTKPLNIGYFRMRDTSMIAANHRYQTTNTNKNSYNNKNAVVMEDEYDNMNSDGRTFVHKNPNFFLEFGGMLPNPQLRYQTYGKLNAETRDNVIVVCHALTGNASLHSWWSALLGSSISSGANLAFDTDKYFIVCANILGSQYGSTSPKCINADTGLEYGMDFPDVSVRDTAKLILKLLTEELNVRSVKSVIGGSFGGMQALEIAYQGLLENDDTKTDAANNNNGSMPFVRSFIPIASNAFHSAWQIGISQVQVSKCKCKFIFIEYVI